MDEITYGRCPSCGKPMHTYVEARMAFIKNCPKCGATICTKNLTGEFWRAIEVSNIDEPVRMVDAGHFSQGAIT